MKKLTLLLFVTGLLVITLANTDCRRKDNSVTPLGTDTITKPPVKDTSGEDIDVQVFLHTPVSGGGGPAAGARIRLFNNFSDMTTYEGDTNYTSKNIVIHTADANGLDTFFKVKPVSNTPTTPSYFKGTNTAYNYYINATYIDNSTTPPSFLTGSIGSYSGQPNQTVIVAPNNAKKGVGAPVVIAVN